MSVPIIRNFSCPQPVDRCAYYLRVGAPMQKLEHQREHVIRYCEQARPQVPDDFRFLPVLP